MEAVALRLRDATRIFGAAAAPIQDILLQLIDKQHQYLTLGQLNNGSQPADIVRHNGQGYLQGWDTFAELAWFSPNDSASVQPLRLGPEAVRNPDCQPSYWLAIRPLLVEMNDTFTASACRADGRP